MKVWMDDASALADAVRRREVRAADALEASLDAIQRSELNTVVTLDAEGARRQAEAIDGRLSRGEDPGLFAGVLGGRSVATFRIYVQPVRQV